MLFLPQSTTSLNTSDAQLVIPFSTKQSTRTAIFSVARTESKVFTSKNVYTLRETLFEKLDGFNIEYTKERTLFKNVAISDFESICVPSEEVKPTKAKAQIGKHEPISVSISSNLLHTPFFV